MPQELEEYVPGIKDGVISLPGATPAKFLIAPSGSGETATYYTDGVDDQAQIQTAIDNLPAQGGIVELAEGTYNISSQIQIIKHGVTLRGRGVDATQINTTASTFDAIRVGNRQVDGVMRNFVRLEDFTISHAGGASTKACIIVDGGGRGSNITNVQTNEGAYGLQLIDLDRVLISNCDINNVRDTGILLQTGLENTYGTVKFLNCSVALSDANSKCMVFDTHPGQASPNRFDRIGIDNMLFFSTSGVSGTKGLVMNVGATAFLIQNSLFESCIDQIELNDETQVALIAVSFIQNSGVSNNLIKMQNDNHTITLMDCRLQQATNGFNAVSGFPSLTFIGRNTNQGNITNLFVGSYSFRGGTDTNFLGDGVGSLGQDSVRYSNIFADKMVLKNLSAHPTPNSINSTVYMYNDDLYVMNPAGAYVNLSELQSQTETQAPPNPPDPVLPPPDVTAPAPPPSADPTNYVQGSTVFTSTSSLSDFNADSPVTVGSESVVVTSGRFDFTLLAVSNHVGINKDLSRRDVRDLKFKYEIKTGATLSNEHTIFHAWTDDYASDFVQIRVLPGTSSSKYRFMIRAIDPNNPTAGFTLEKRSLVDHDFATEYDVELYVHNGGFGLKVDGNLLIDFWGFSNENKYIGGVTFGKFYSSNFAGTQYMDDITFYQDYVTPTGPSTDATKLTSVYNSWVARYVNSAGAVVRPYPEGVDGIYAPWGDVVSEGIGYALIFAVMMNDVTTFDLVEAWAYANLDRRNNSMTADDLMGWHYDIANGTMYDWNFATDADVDRAAALIWAARRKARGDTGWASSSINYSTRATNIITDLKNNAFRTYDSKHYMVTDSFQSSANPAEMNPSYVSPAYYKLFKDFTSDTFWDAAVTGSYDLFTKSTSDTLFNRQRGANETGVGLPPDWVGFDPVNGTTENPPNNRLIKYSYDAFRTFFRIYMHYHLFGDTTARTYLQGAASTFFRAKWTANGRIYAEYDYDGEVMRFGGTVRGAYEKSMMTWSAYFTLLANAGDTTAPVIYSNKLQNLFTKNYLGNFYADNASTEGIYRGQPSYFNLSWCLWAEMIKQNVFTNIT